MDLSKYFEDIEKRINCQEEEELLSSWYAFLEGNFKDKVFTPRRKNVSLPGIEFPKINVNDAIEDLDLMILSQLWIVSENLRLGSGQPLLVRANYGTAILPSIFGCEVFMMDKELNTLPTAINLSIEQIDEIIAKKEIDINQALVKKVFEFSERFKELSKRYPKIQKYVHMCHPDLQGPFDVCELLMGSDIFYHVFDVPQKVKALLEIITNAYMKIMDKFINIFGLQEYSAHWTYLQKGNIVLRIDSAMNFSSEHYEEFFYPYDAKIFAKYKGGTVHFCGKGDHYIHLLSKLPHINSIHMTQPEYNDMEIILKNTVCKNINIVGFKQHSLMMELKDKFSTCNRVNTNTFEVR